MTGEISSRSLKKVTEITHIAPLKQGFVQSDLAMTYPIRLKGLLKALYALRRYDVSAFESPVDTLGLIHFARWTVIDDDTRLLFTTNFDGSWEGYIHSFVDTFPRLLDLIWSHCEGYPPRAGSSYREFSAWVQRHQVETHTLYGSNADVTVLDVKWMKELKQHYDVFCRRVQEDSSPDAVVETVRRFQKDVYGIDVHLPPAEPEPMPLAGRAVMERLRSFFGGTDGALFEAAVRELDPNGRHAPGEVPERPPSEPRKPAADNIQGGILAKYDWADAGRIALLAVDASKAKEWLRLARERVTRASTQNEDQRAAVNVALTFAGLRRMGLDESELQSFPIEFRLGMEERAEVLRDVGLNHPLRWPNEVDTARVDAVVIEHTADGATDADREPFDELTRACDVHVLHAEAMAWAKNAAGARIEPFGFADGLSQPTLAGAPSPGATYDNATARGEFLLGHPDDRGDVELRPKSPRLRNDSSYLVLRKLEQDVDGFRALVEKNRAAWGIDGPGEAEARLMGRKPSGEPLVGKNEPFDEDPDANGAGCPFHAHARLANPRRRPETSTGEHRALPRLLRWAMPYERAGTKGLVFMAVNASIASQFEVMQQWINGANINGGMSTDPDPVVGAVDLDADALDPAFSFMHGDELKTLVRDDPKQQLVRLLWGLYLFLPSVEAMDHIIDAPHEDTTPGRSLLELVEAKGRDRHLVKKLLEEVGVAPMTAPRLWSELRAAGGSFETGYGTLVSSADDVREVLENHDAFSVSEYDARMRETTGRFYLGYDDEDRWKLESSVPNAYLLGIDVEKVCANTEKHAKTVLQGIIHASRLAEAEEKERRKMEGLRYSEPIPGVTIPLRIYGAGVLLRVANEYFGVPVDPSSSALAKVRAVSAYIFYPNPEAFVGELARTIGPAIAGEIREAVLAASPDPSGTLVEQLLAARAPSEGLDDDWVVRSVGGVFSGFFVPTIASFVSIMRGWHQRGELGRARLRYQRGNEDKDALQAMFMEELRKMPMPSLLHRKAAADVELASGGRIAKGDTVVVGLVNAPAPDTGDPKDDLLFGAGRHWCKGANMALGVLRGLIATVLANDDLRPGTSELDLRYVGLSGLSGLSDPSEST